MANQNQHQFQSNILGLKNRRNGISSQYHITAGTILSYPGQVEGNGKIWILCPPTTLAASTWLLSLIQGEELHAIIPKNLIWKFDNKIREGGLYTTEKLHLTAGKPKFWPAKSEKRGYFRWNKSLSALDAYSMSMIPHNFSFTEFEALESNLQNIQLTGS